jgi:N-acetylglucosamine kinase-like BadF-type ATPase
VPDKTNPESSGPATARPGHSKSFQQVTEAARQALRDRGLSEEEIEQELQRTTRPDK